MADNTFLGLQPYTEDDAYRFKGRIEESQELFRLIVRNDFTVCYAESGEGKTSLLNAGVFPLLRENMYFPIAITFTSDDYKVTPDSFDTIIDRCIKDSLAEYNEKNKGVNVEYKLCSTDFQGMDSQVELQRELSKYSWWKLRNYRPQAMGLTFTPVFVFDQFEEVFNLPGSIVWIKKFFDWLEDISSDSYPEEIVEKVRKIIGDKAAFPTIKEEKGFKAVFSLRKEFIGELDYWGMQTHFIPALKDNRYCLKALTYEGAKKVMTQQERFDEVKVEQVLTHFVGQYSREPEKTIVENLPAIPALLLSVVCDSWEKDVVSFAKLSTDAIGQSLNKILEKFFDETIEAVIKDLTHHKKDAITPDSIRKDIDTAMFDLVDVNGKRVRVKAVTTIGTISMDSGKRFSETLPIVKYKEILNKHRIIKITKIDGEDYVEIVHDCLCPIIAKRREVRLAAEAKEREERLLREQAKKMRKRISVFGLLAIIAIGLMALFFFQNRRNQIVERRSQIVELTLNQTRNSLVLSESEKDEMAALNDSITKLNKSLTAQYAIVLRQRDSLAKGSEEKQALIIALRTEKALTEKQLAELIQKDKIIDQFGEFAKIKNDVAGGLKNKIGPDLKYIIKSLSVSGELNGTDIAFIRDMINNGILTELDIENTAIVSGGEPYYNSAYKQYHTEKDVIGAYMFENCRTLSSLKLPKTIIKIEMGVFSKCDGLNELTIASREIEDLSISYCKNLETIRLTENVRVFNGFNLSGCKNLKSIVVAPGNYHLKDDNGVLYNKDGTQLIKYPEGKLGDSFFIPNTVSVIKRGAFMNSHLSVVTIPMSVKEIESSAFNDCEELSVLRIANSVESIGISAFSGCESLESLNLPSSLSEIESLCFMGCRKLREVNIGENVRKIDGSAFASCSSLQKLNISEKNRYYTVENGIVYSSDKNVLVKCPAFLRQETIVIPSGVETIGNNAFDDCESISVVVLPETVSRIDHSAFDDCSISSINIPSNMKSIDTFAFGRCKLLTNIISDVRDIEELKIDSYTFKYISDNCMWVVPKGPRKDKNMYMELYKKQPWWKSSWTITYK